MRAGSTCRWRKLATVPISHTGHQVQLYLKLAPEAGFQTGEKRVTAELVDTVLPRQLDDLEPTLTRHGHRLKDIVEQFYAKLADVRALYSLSKIYTGIICLLSPPLEIRVRKDVAHSRESISAKVELLQLRE